MRQRDVNWLNNTPIPIRIFLCYNIILIAVILLIDRSFTFAHLISYHIFLIFIYFWANKIYSETRSKYIKLLLMQSIIAIAAWLHFESGALNVLMSYGFFDSQIKALDSFVFGQNPNQILFRYGNSFIDQIMHISYFSFYLILFIPFTLIYLKNIEEGEYMLGGMIFTLFLCFLFFIFFPVIGPTADRVSLDMFSSNNGFISIMNYIFSNYDNDGGAFPSSHVALSLVVVLFVREYYDKLFHFYLINLILLSLSTIYCSYHYAIDVVVGYIVGLFVYLLYQKCFNFSKQFSGE